MKVQRKLLAILLAVCLFVGSAMPASAASHCNAVVTASSLNLRSGAGNGYALLAVAPRGATLTVIGIATENSGWFKVDYNGQIGYMDAAYLINAETSEAAEAIAQAANAVPSAVQQPDPAGAAEPVETAEPVESAEPAAAAEPAAESTPAPTAEPTPDPADPANIVITPYGDANATVTGNMVRYRTSPGGDIIGNFNSGSRIYISGTSGAWYEVSCNGTVGYVHSSFVSVDSAAANTTVTVAEATPAPAAPPANSAAGGSIVSTAMSYQGVPYVYGGTSPEGFDCSGLCYYVYQQCGYSIERVAHSIYVSTGTAVTYDQLAPGDIICFGNASYVWHVGIYIGGGQFIHAPYTGAVVRVESLSGTYLSNFVCAKRVA